MPQFEADPEKVQRLRELQQKLAALPSPMIGMSFEDFVETQCKEHLWSKQRTVAQAIQEHKFVAVKSAHAMGKALALDTPLPTPDGWTTMGDVQAGGELFDEHGDVCRVVAKSPVWDDRRCFRVEFDDGSSVVASAEHEWSVLDVTRRPRGGVDDWRDHWDRSVIRTTDQLASSLVTDNGQRRWRIPVTGVLSGEESSLPAYTLGVWLGDGTTVDSAITVNHWDAPTILAGIAGEGVIYRVRSSSVRESSACYGLINGFKQTLVDLGMLGRKHIPAVLLRADRRTRLALLQGIMDTDGYKGVSASATITTMLPGLARDIMELVRSLGGKPYLSSKRARIGDTDYGTAYIVNFRPSWETFRLERQLDGFRGAAVQKSRQTIRTIVAVDEVATVPTQCVQVDSLSHLFLCGEAMVPTHNSWLASRAVAWWIASHPVGDAFVVSSAPTFAQVRAVLWREIAVAAKRADLPGNLLQTEWWIDGQLVAFGRKPADGTPTAFQGIHANNVLVILDEACGIEKDLWIAAGSLVANQGSRMLAIGNPDDPTSHFASVCAPGSAWHTIRISALDSPNFTGEQVPEKLKGMLADQSFLDFMKSEVGEGSGPWISKVTGDFPVDADWAVVPPSAVAKCRRPEQESDGDEPVVLGVDVGAGGDQTVVYERRGRKAGRVWRASTPEITQATGLVMEAIRASGATQVNVDSIGVGWGVSSALQEFRRQGTHNARVSAVNVGASSSDTKRWSRLRDEIWWMARTNSTKELWDLAAIDDKTVAQLTSPKYSLDASGRIKVEPKDETRKRLGRSPDDADALLLAFYTPAGNSGSWIGAWRQMAGVTDSGPDVIELSALDQ